MEAAFDEVGEVGLEILLSKGTLEVWGLKVRLDFVRKGLVKSFLALAGVSRVGALSVLDITPELVGFADES